MYSSSSKAWGYFNERLHSQIYLTTLEMTKTWASEPASKLAPTASAASAMSNFAGGAFASLLTQSVVVPIDVVSQRLMVAGDSSQARLLIFGIYLLYEIALLFPGELAVTSLDKGVIIRSQGKAVQGAEAFLRELNDLLHGHEGLWGCRWGPELWSAH